MNNRPRILVIDDENDILDILNFMFQREGYEVVNAVSGKDAFEKILQEPFHAVVSDLCMPEMDGLTLLKQVRAQRYLTPFIFLSGHAKPWDEHQMINFGAYELIVKPNVDKVLPALKKVLMTQKEIESLKLSEEASEFMEILHAAHRRIA